MSHLKYARLHLVDTIGSVDDLIEKCQQIIAKLNDFGLIIFGQNDMSEPVLASTKLNFEKGKEVGSANYLAVPNGNSIPYLRVGDLNNQDSSMHVNCDASLPLAKEDDVLISFDGAVGRVGIGLSGTYSSGIRKIISNSNYTQGYIYFWAESKTTQQTIKEHAFGTTIEHAGKSLDYLMIDANPNCISTLLDRVFSQIILMKRKIKILKQVKQQLLDFYF